METNKCFFYKPYSTLPIIYSSIYKCENSHTIDKNIDELISNAFLVIKREKLKPNKTVENFSLDRFYSSKKSDASKNVSDSLFNNFGLFCLFLLVMEFWILEKAGHLRASADSITWVLQL